MLTMQESAAGWIWWPGQGRAGQGRARGVGSVCARCATHTLAPRLFAFTPHPRQNFFLYFFGVLFNLAGLLVVIATGGLAPGAVFTGFSAVSWVRLVQWPACGYGGLVVVMDMAGPERWHSFNLLCAMANRGFLAGCSGAWWQAHGGMLACVSAGSHI